jgi:hypothetical protein
MAEPLRVVDVQRGCGNGRIKRLIETGECIDTDMCVLEIAMDIYVAVPKGDPTPTPTPT